METLRALADQLRAGRKSSRVLLEECLGHIDERPGEGTFAFLKVYSDEARRTADWIDGMRKIGASLPPFAGIPVSVKDLFDIAGSVTRAGSVVLANEPPATSDAMVVTRLRSAGFIVIGRTNMTEFAYSAMGLNPHYGTPACAWDRASRRIPGGSSSGGVVSVTDGMAAAAIGTDTGGSCRIPAALNGIVGFKPTARRVPQNGSLPLAPSLDFVGPLTRSVECAAILDAVMAAEPDDPLPDVTVRGLRLAVPKTLVLDDLEPPIASAFQTVCSAAIRSWRHRRRYRTPAVERAQGDQQQGWLCRGRILCVAPQPHRYPSRCI